ncbi:MAG TPA: hypothetical protein VGP79_12075 [Bryobacteraceae bacterium]|nr:hypothetical protein [Bryobacteraceae bacterium]
MQKIFISRWDATPRGIIAPVMRYGNFYTRHADLIRGAVAVVASYAPLDGTYSAVELPPNGNAVACLSLRSE